MDELIIIWAVVIAAALLLEFITYEFYTAWFSAGGLAALLMAVFGIDLHWQIIVFVVLSTTLLLFLRPIVKRLLETDTVPTNAEANKGKVVKLLEDVVDGLSTIKLHDVVWNVSCNASLKAGTEVIIKGTEGNKYIVEKKGG